MSRNRIVILFLSLILGIVTIAEGAEKYRPAPGAEPVIGRYLVTLDSSVAAGAVDISAQSLAHGYGGQLELYAASDGRTFAVTMLPSRARSLSADPRVREVVEVPQQDSREAAPAAAPSAALTARHLVPVTQQFSSPGSYTYDGSGNIKTIGNDSFVYDHLGRLVDSFVLNNSQQSYTYDIYGNRLSATRGMNALGCLGGTTCEAAVTMRETPSTTNHLANVTYDDAGNVLQGYGATYVYDGTGMVTQATVGTDVRDFVYTADDERIAVKRGASWTWSVRDQGGKVLREYTSSGASPFALTAHVWSKDYVWRDGLLLASISVPAGFSTPATYHYHLDHLGTPRLITRDGGTIVSSHSYYPFGAEMDLAPQENPAEAMKFTGHERDIVVGNDHTVDYMHARYYNANAGRFLSVDPSLDLKKTISNPQMWNRYSYVVSNPMRFTDPDGREHVNEPGFTKPLSEAGGWADEPSVSWAFYAQGGLFAAGAAEVGGSWLLQTAGTAAMANPGAVLFGMRVLAAFSGDPGNMISVPGGETAAQGKAEFLLGQVAGNAKSSERGATFAQKLGFNKETLVGALRSHLLDRANKATVDMSRSSPRVSVTGTMTAANGVKQTITSVWQYVDKQFRLVTAW